jgi:hypothetical protein
VAEITAKEFRKQFKSRYGADVKSYAELKDLLGLDGTVDGKYKMEDSDLETLATAMKIQAPTSRGSSTKSTARRIRQRKTEARVKLDFRLLPGDRSTLESVQEWVDEHRQPLPDDFAPKKVKQKGGGLISYEVPGRGWVDNVPAVEFAKMQNGTMPWKVPEPNRGDIREQAQKLESLSFQAKECRVCHKEIQAGRGPEMALMYQLLNGRFVLPFIGHLLENNQTEARFRRAHLICAIGEDQIAKILVASDANLGDALGEIIDDILREAQQKRPETTIDEVEASLDDILAYIESGGE